jgi:hypothetical protein
MLMLVNDEAIDVPGLRRTAERLHNVRRGTSIDRIFFQLLRARIQYLGEEGLLVIVRAA